MVRIDNLLERVRDLEKLVQRHYETMGEHVGALDKRVRELEKK